ncbi:MAG: hypothetical protein MUD10_01195 [Candidatus Pacebacteria bacterium]|jgi:hypothetical protein|nr:hypothetical protein [Candidatus Paceibacterota bacterium]
MPKKEEKEPIKIQKNEYKELVDFLAVKFDKIDERFNIIDEKFNEINNKLDRKADKSEMKTIMERTIRIENKIDDYRAEQIGIKRQVGLHEKKLASI